MIAVHDTACVQHLQRLDDEPHQTQGFGRSERAVPQTRGERFALDQFHRNERLRLPFSELEHLADQRMRKPCRNPRLADQATLRIRPTGIRPQNLQRHPAVKTGIDGHVHHAHAAFAELVDDAVRTDVRRLRRILKHPLHLPEMSGAHNNPPVPIPRLGDRVR